VVQLHQSLDCPVDLLLEEDRVAALIPPGQLRLGLFTQVRGSQEPLVEILGFVVDLADFGACPDFVNELDGGRK
jgi:hypothetical protein